MRLKLWIILLKKKRNYNDRRTNHFMWLRTCDDQETKDLQGGRVWAKMLCSLTFVTFFKLVILLALLEIEIKKCSCGVDVFQIFINVYTNVAVSTREPIPFLTWPFLWSISHSGGLHLIAPPFIAISSVHFG